MEIFRGVSKLERAFRRAVLTIGEAKRPMVERWLLLDPELPISAVRRSHTWLFLDEAAAPGVTLHRAK